MSIDSQPANSGEHYEAPELIVLEFEDTEGSKLAVNTVEVGFTINAS